MGANYFQQKEKGLSLREAYKSAVDEAIFENGNDSYNGTISTTHNCIDLTNEFKRSGKTINKYLEDFDKEDKGTCYAICLKEPVKNTVKRKVKVEHVLYDGTRKWELTYVVRTYDSIVSRHPTKTEAVERAKRKTEETGIRTTVEMEKKLVTGSSTVAIVKSESKTNEKLGEWVLFGWAYC